MYYHLSTCIILYAGYNIQVSVMLHTVHVLCTSVNNVTYCVQVCMYMYMYASDFDILSVVAVLCN